MSQLLPYGVLTDSRILHVCMRLLPDSMPALFVVVDQCDLTNLEGDIFVEFLRLVTEVGVGVSVHEDRIHESDTDPQRHILSFTPLERKS